MAKIITKLALAAVVVAGASVAAGAAELNAHAVLKPVQGLTFDIGSKHAVTYYKPAAGICDLTLVMADRPNDDGTVATVASRLSVSVQPGKTARIDTAEGKSLEFGCAVGGTEMTVNTVKQVAWTPKATKG